jgi:hypothetical protein
MIKTTEPTKGLPKEITKCLKHNSSGKASTHPRGNQPSSTVAMEVILKTTIHCGRY